MGQRTADPFRQGLDKLRLRGPDERGEIGGDGVKELEVPGVDELCFGFGGTTKQKSIVDAAADEAVIGGFLDGVVVFRGFQRDRGEALADLLDEEKYLLWRDQGLNWQRGHGGINFRESVKSACRMFLFCVCEQSNARFVVDMAAAKRGDQHGSVQELSQSISSRIRFSRSASIKSGMDVSEGSPW